MKKILFLVKEPSTSFEAFEEAAIKAGVSLEMALYDNIIVNYTNQKVIILVKGQPLENYDLVVFRTVGKEIELSVIISRYCQDKGIKLTDQAFYHQKPWIDVKSFEYLVLQKEGIPIIPSFLTSFKQLPQIKGQLEYPVVAKATDSSKGKDVFLCHSEQELVKLFSRYSLLLIQKFINNNSYYRLFIINGQVVETVKRTKDPQKFGQTIPSGSKAEQYTLDLDSQRQAIKAAQALEYDIAEIDLIKDESGKTYIIEVNRAPQFKVLMRTTGVNIPQKIVEFWLSLIE